MADRDPVAPLELSKGRRLLFIALQTLIFGGLFFALAELGARYVFGFRPVTHAYFIFQYDPVLGWRHQPNAEDVFVKLGFQQPIKINSRGLREREIGYEKPPGVFRVLAVGDSNTAGFEVPAEKVWMRVTESILRERGHQVEFLNAGHRAYGTDQVLLFLREEGMKYQPDLVLYFWSRNDLDDNMTVHRPYRKYGKPYFELDEAGNISLQGVPVPRFDIADGVRVAEDGKLHRIQVPTYLRAILWLRDNIVSRSAFGTAMVYSVANAPSMAKRVISVSTFGDFQEGGVPDRVTETRSFRLTLSILREMQKVAAEGGARLQVIGVADWWSNTLRDHLGMPQMRVYEAFRNSLTDPDAVKTRFDPHWNELGHQLYAEQLANALLEHGLVPSAGSPAAPVAADVRSD